MRLKRETGFFGVFCVASGTMISSGLFILPAIVFPIVGPAIFLAYFFSALLMIPAILSKSELATAMPKSGGDYFFIHRSLGAFMGTFAGFAAWYSLSLKSAFALLGIGLLIEPLFFEASPELMKLFAVGIIFFFTAINIIGVKESSLFQIVLVIFIIVILSYFIIKGMHHIDVNRYVPFKPQGWHSVFTVMGMIFISYGGLTKIASIAEEVKNPKVNIPAGMFAAFIVTTSLYIFTLFVAVGLLDGKEFSETLNPVSIAAAKLDGNIGFAILTLAAVLAFITTGNAGLLSSSRIPLAMAEDNLIPSFFSKVNIKLKTPVSSILFTSLFMISVVIFLDLENLVKVASTMMLILFFLVNLSVILMRESKIASYKPSFRSPLYPYIQFVGMIVYLLLIIEMGYLPFIITLGFVGFSFFWYFLYSKRRNMKQSALLQIVERITSREIKSSVLTDELRDILYERDGIVEDKFDSIVRKATFLDLKKETDDEGLLQNIASTFSDKFNIPSEKIYRLFRKEEKKFDSVIYEGLAIMNIVVKGSNLFEIVIVRSKHGIALSKDSPKVHILFALAGSKDERSFYLQTLIAIAQIVQNKEFIKNWKKANSIHDLKNLILLSERIRSRRI
ncbi:MAG TPA: hypothetical protein DDX98_13530 [Bacteroidales bacterium]|jgi:APA family basic amino acid/polyamine antiporter|nr:hypothetical protein [Bacteroidales bacterium]